MRDEAAIYEIQIAGRLESYWSGWFDGMDVDQRDEVTILRGVVPDQAALYGLLVKVRDLGLMLLSVRRLCGV